jgi:hypothetical protein
MYKLELFTRVRSPHIWQTRKRANAPDTKHPHLGMLSHRAFMIYKYTYITGVKKPLLNAPFIILRFINIDNYQQYQI